MFAFQTICPAGKSARTLLCSIGVMLALSSTTRWAEAQTRTLDTPTEPQPVVSAKGTITKWGEYYFDPIGRDGGTALIEAAATHDFPKEHAKWLAEWDTWGPQRVGSYELVDDLLYMDRTYQLTGVIDLKIPIRVGDNWREYEYVESQVFAPWREHEQTRHPGDPLHRRDQKFVAKASGTIILVESAVELGAFGGVMVHRGRHDGFNWQELPDRDKQVEVLHFSIPQLNDGGTTGFPQVANGGGFPATANGILGKWRVVAVSELGVTTPYEMWVIENDKITDSLGNPPTIIRIDAANHHIDLLTKLIDGGEQWLYGVYRVEGDRLTISYGASRPAGVDDQNYWKFNFVREQ